MGGTKKTVRGALGEKRKKKRSRRVDASRNWGEKEKGNLLENTFKECKKKKMKKRLQA